MAMVQFGRPRPDVLWTFGGPYDRFASMHDIEELERWAEDCPLGIIATEVDGTVVYWNGGATAMYHWTAREAVGRNIMTLTPSLQSKVQAAEVMNRLREGEPWHGKIVLRRRDGFPFVAFVANLPLNEPGPIILGVSGYIKDRPRVLQQAASLQTR